MQNGTAVKPNNGGGSPPSLPRELLTAEEAARFLALFTPDGKPSASAIYHKKHRHEFDGFGIVVQMGRGTRYSISGLRRYIAAHTV